MAQGNRWAVLIGGFTGDGSREHALFRLDQDDRIPIFTSQAAAEEYVLLHKLGKFGLIAEVVAEANAATELTYLKTGTRITATGIRQQDKA